MHDTSSELVPSSIEELGTRISVVAEAVGDRKTAAKVAGISSDSLQRYIRGDVQPPFHALVNLCKAANYSIEWLASGEGPMRKPAGVTEPPNGYQIDACAPISPDPGDYSYVPLYDVYASAGHGAVIDHEPVKAMLAFKQSWLKGDMGLNPQSCCLIYITGDSMEPTLRKNDIVLLDRACTSYADDGVYCLRFNGGLVVKRLQRINSTDVKIISDNHIYESYIIGVAELDIVGRVVWAGKRF